MRPADGRRERRLGDQEYKALGNALRTLEGNMWPAALGMCRFLTLTGWRTGEAQALRWDDLDLARRTAILPDTKATPKDYHFSLIVSERWYNSILDGMRHPRY